MNPTDKVIYTFFGETTNYTDPDAFASDVALSLLNPEEPDQQVDIALFEQLRTLWHVANDPFKVLLECMGLSQTQCSTRFCIPLRTVQNWAGELRTPAPYVRLMMAELAGLLDIRGSQK